MKSFNVYGDTTEDPDQFVHCKACFRHLTWHQWEDGLCPCGFRVDGDADKCILRGVELREAREALDASMREWYILNGLWSTRVKTREQVMKEYP